MYTFVFVVSLLQILGRAPIEDALKRANRDFQDAQFILHHPNEQGRNSFAIQPDFKAFLSLLREQSQMCDTLRRSGVQACIVLMHPIPEGLYRVIETYKHNIHIVNLDPVHYALPRFVSESGGWKRSFNLERSEGICNYSPPKMIVAGGYDMCSPAYERATPPQVKFSNFTNPTGTLRLELPSYKNNAPPAIDVRHQESAIEVRRIRECDGAGMKRQMTLEYDERKRQRCEDDGVSELLQNILHNMGHPKVSPTSPPVGIEVNGRFIEFLRKPREKRMCQRSEFIYQPSDVQGKQFRIYPRNEKEDEFRLTIAEYRFNRDTTRYDLPYNYDSALTFGTHVVVPKDTMLIPYEREHMSRGRWIEWECYQRGRRFVAGYWNSHDFEVPLFMTFSKPRRL